MQRRERAHQPLLDAGILAREFGPHGCEALLREPGGALLEEFVLRREVQVQALAGNAGGAREVVHRRLPVAVAQENADGGLQDRHAPVGVGGHQRIAFMGIAFMGTRRATQARPAGWGG
jgi:hypothetical protein